MCADQFAKAASTWREKYKLIFHEREKRSKLEPFIQEILALSKNRALLSLDPVPYNKIDSIFLSSHIGLIAYNKAYGEGRENAHKASGKLGQFLKCGIPVIAFGEGGALETVIGTQSNDNPTGVFFYKQSEDELIKKIIEFSKLEFNKADCVKNAKKFSRENFTYKMLDQINNLILELTLKYKGQTDLGFLRIHIHLIVFQQEVKKHMLKK